MMERAAARVQATEKGMMAAATVRVTRVMAAAEPWAKAAEETQVMKACHTSP